MKRFLSFLVAMFLVSKVLWAYDFQSGDLYYNITSSTEPYTAEVTYQELSCWMCNYYGLTSVTIPTTVTYDGTTYSVTSIGSQAFYHCPSLTSITIPESVTSIGNYAFDNTAWYNNQPDGVIYINKVLYKYKGTMPQGTTIAIKEGTISISDNAFYGCTGLTSITIPNSVTSIGGKAFYNVPNIVYNGTATGSPWGAKSVNGYVDGYLVYADATKTTLLACYTTATGTITIPNSVISIGDRAFSGCSGLTSITIPNSVTSIGNDAFYGCSGLTSVTIPNSVTSIGNDAFYGCPSLTSITIPESVTSIGNDAFDNTAWYNNQPDGVIYINKVLYKYKGTMPQGTTIAIKEGTISISDYAFCGCTDLTSIIIPNSVTSIGYCAFMGCSGLTSITIPNSVTSIGGSAFSGCRGLTSITIPNSVTSIGSSAFSGCTGLTSVTIGNSVTSIGGSAFSGCTGLTSITIPNSVTSIGSGTFYGCSGLTSVTIPNGVTSIGNAAFYGCTALTSIRVKAKVPPQCNDNTFSNVPKDIPVYVACDKEAYQNSTGWSSFTNIIEYREYSAIVQSSANGSAEMLSYTCDNKLTIQATSNEHYHFTQWSDGNTDNLRIFVVLQDTILTAEFAIDQHTISASSENGSIDGVGLYDYGTTATLTAVADEHYHFTQWSDGNTDNPRSVSVEENATYTAEFAIDRHTITTTCDIRYGEVTGDGVYDYGTRITLTAIPNSGYEFKQWSNGLTYNPYRFTVLEDLTLEAVFVSSAATALEDAPVDTTTPQKVLIDGQVYVLRNGKTYTTTGLEVK